MTILSALIQTYAEWRRYRGTASELAPSAENRPASRSRSR
jgi:uncharacterized protein YjiS (DUF1127 family)